MGVISSYPNALYTDCDGTEKTIISDSGTTKNFTLSEWLKYARQQQNQKPVTQATRTSVPTSTPTTPGDRNLWWIDTSGGNVDISAIGTIGLLPGQTAVFRKTTTDKNKVFWTGTVGGSGLTQATRVELGSHYNADLREIELVWDGAAWTLVGSEMMNNEAASLDWTGATDQRSAFASFLARYSTGDVINLPQGTILINGGGSSGNYITFPTGTRIIGHPKGTTIKFTAPSGSHNPLRLSDNLTIEDITFQWDMSSHPSAGSDCSLVYGTGVTNVMLRRCKFFGDADTAVTAVGGQLYWLGRTICLDIRNSTNITVEQCEVARSTGSNYGLQIYGGSDHVYRDCYFHHNAADGVKILGNSANGQPSSIRFVNCRSDANGQIIMQGQTVYTATYTTNTTITPVNGARYLVNGAFTLTLNNGTNGDQILISKLIGSGTCTVSYTGGSTVLNSTFDRSVAHFTFSGGAWGLTNSTYTNGEGWDCTGSDIVFDNCVANGNEGSGFQVKPTLIDTSGKNVASGIRFRGCSSKNSWGANGFGIVNNITDSAPREVSPQDIVFESCIAEGNRANGFIASSSTPLPIFGTMMTNCISRNNGQDGLAVQGPCRWFTATACTFRGNGAVTVGWNVKLHAAKGVRFRDCYFSGVDPVAQSLTQETDVDNNVNARCYGVLIDKTKNGTMTDVVFDYCRWHNHLKTNGANTDIRFYLNDAAPALTDFSQTIASSRLSLGSGSTGVLIVNSQQTATLTHSSANAYNAGTTYGLVDGITGLPSVVVNGGNMYRYINATPSAGNAPPNATYWVQAGSDVVSFT